eukprot:GHVN01084297.1.p1 GENE.GHVN01084297.1~~GHVN01084297.1.p1  ORF type:complete len:795 (-),score=92.63 GHVN01084297.1:763-3147(-)
MRRLPPAVKCLLSNTVCGQPFAAFPTHFRGSYAFPKRGIWPQPSRGTMQAAVVGMLVCLCMLLQPIECVSGKHGPWSISNHPRQMLLSLSFVFPNSPLGKLSDRHNKPRTYLALFRRALIPLAGGVRPACGNLPSSHLSRLFSAMDSERLWAGHIFNATADTGSGKDETRINPNWRADENGEPDEPLISSGWVFPEEQQKSPLAPGQVSSDMVNVVPQFSPATLTYLPLGAVYGPHQTAVRPPESFRDTLSNPEDSLVWQNRRKSGVLEDGSEIKEEDFGVKGYGEEFITVIHDGFEYQSRTASAVGELIEDYGTVETKHFDEITSDKLEETKRRERAIVELGLDDDELVHETGFYRAQARKEMMQLAASPATQYMLRQGHDDMGEVFEKESDSSGSQEWLDKQREVGDFIAYLKAIDLGLNTFEYLGADNIANYQEKRQTDPNSRGLTIAEALLPMSPLQVRGSSFAIIGEPPSSVNSLNPGLGGLSIFERECSAFGLLKNDTRGDGVYSRQLHHGFRVLPDIARNINVLLYERGYLLDRRERKSLGQTKIEPYIYRHLSYWGPLGSKPETDDVKREGVALAEKAFALRQKLVNNDLVDEGVVVVDRFTSATDTERLQSLLKNEDEFRKSKESRSLAARLLQLVAELLTNQPHLRFKRRPGIEGLPPEEKMIVNSEGYPTSIISHPIGEDGKSESIRIEIFGKSLPEIYRPTGNKFEWNDGLPLGADAVSEESLSSLMGADRTTWLDETSNGSGSGARGGGENQKNEIGASVEGGASLRAFLFTSIKATTAGG